MGEGDITPSKAFFKRFFFHPSLLIFLTKSETEQHVGEGLVPPPLYILYIYYILGLSMWFIARVDISYYYYIKESYID